MRNDNKNKNDDDSSTRNGKMEAKNERDIAPSTMGDSTMGLLADSGDSDLHHGTTGTSDD